VIRDVNSRPTLTGVIALSAVSLMMPYVHRADYAAAVLIRRCVLIDLHTTSQSSGAMLRWQIANTATDYSSMEW